MPLFKHEINGGLRRGVQSIPLFGSAASNTVVLGITIVLLVVAICLVCAPLRAADERPNRFKVAIRCAVYAIVPVLLLLHVYGGTIAATVEGGYSMDVRNFISQPVRGGEADVQAVIKPRDREADVQAVIKPRGMGGYTVVGAPTSPLTTVASEAPAHEAPENRELGGNAAIQRVADTLAPSPKGNDLEERLAKIEARI